MKTLEALIQDWAQPREVMLTPHPGGVAFQVTAEQGAFSMMLFPQEEGRLLLATALFALFVPEEQRESLLIPLAEINCNLSWGSFCLRMETGELYFAQSQFIPQEDQVAQELLEICLNACVQVMDAHLPVLAKLCTP